MDILSLPAGRLRGSAPLTAGEMPASGGEHLGISHG